ncbi:MAG: hypothetical protein ACO25F_12195 [Erythrobacter sp.]
MTDLRRRFMEDKALRDAARSIIDRQLSRVRTGVSGKWIGDSLADRYGDKLIDLAGDARDTLKDNRGLIAGAGVLAGVATVAWLARDRLLGLFGATGESADEDVPADREDQHGA